VARGWTADVVCDKLTSSSSASGASYTGRVICYRCMTLRPRCLLAFLFLGLGGLLPAARARHRRRHQRRGGRAVGQRGLGGRAGARARRSPSTPTPRATCAGRRRSRRAPSAARPSRRPRAAQAGAAAWPPRAPYGRRAGLQTGRRLTRAAEGSALAVKLLSAASSCAALPSKHAACPQRGDTKAS